MSTHRDALYCYNVQLTPIPQRPSLSLILWRPSHGGQLWRYAFTGALGSLRAYFILDFDLCFTRRFWPICIHSNDQGLGIMTASTQAETTTGSFPFSQAEWDQTPVAVQTHLVALHTQLQDLHQQHQQLQIQVDQLQGRVNQTSQTSSKPPSSDSPFKKPARGNASGKRGGRKGHPGSGPVLLEPTAVQVVHPPACPCGAS